MKHKLTTYREEHLKDYSMEELKKPISLKLCLGEVLCMKGLASKNHFYELADKLRAAEKKANDKP